MTTPTARLPGKAEAGTEPVAGSLAPEPPRQAGVDRFDDAIVVTRARAWIGLAACLALVLGVVVWATVATVDRTVSAPGIALVNGTITAVASPVTGTVVALYVTADTPVRESEVIGLVANSANKDSQLVAPISGRVISMEASVGSSIHQGETLASLTAVQGPLVIRMFLPPAQAQLVGRGMRAIMTLPGGPPVQGRITHIGQLPLTEHEVADAIGSPALAALVAPSDGVVSVTVTPTSGAAELDAGDEAAVSLIVGSQHPIGYVF
jgi:biotin carboxyl carrier protein